MTKRLAVGGMGTIETVSLDRNKPGKVIVKLVLFRNEGMVEALSALSDRQLQVAVTLDSLQGAMDIPERDVEENEAAEPGDDKTPPFSERLRKDVEEAAQ